MKVMAASRVLPVILSGSGLRADPVFVDAEAKGKRQKAKAFRALTRPSHFLCWCKESNQRKHLPRSDLQQATGRYAGIRRLGILLRLRTAHILCAALRVSRFSMAVVAVPLRLFRASQLHQRWTT
ncbi:MAG TPA: hypothetical protein VIG88_10465 [Lysobacter sp.]